MSGTQVSPVQFGNPWAYAAAAQFAVSLELELPSGLALHGADTAGLMQGCAEAIADLHANAQQLSEVETLPSTTNLLLPFWEQDYGLPDCCTPLGASVQQRRNALLAKIAQIGGQSEAYFIAVAAALGWTITITRGAINSFQWTINVAQEITPVYFRAGVSTAGDRLVDWDGNSELQCVMNQIAPPHTTLIFSYGS